MNLFQRLLLRRLCNEVPVDGGEGGGGATAQEPAPEKQDAPANGDTLRLQVQSLVRLMIRPILNQKVMTRSL